MTSLLLLGLLGAAVGGFGTLIGAGGGFLLVPVLLLLYPQEEPETITSISLAVVFFNAFSGSVAYARLKRIDYRSGGWFALAAIPGAIAGAWATHYVARRAFDGLFGLVLIGIGMVLLFRRAPSAEGGHAPAGRGQVVRSLVDADGVRYTWSFRPILGLSISVAVGFLSSLLGIGGGIIHVPALVYLLDFPAHVATATSHFILAWMALAGTGVHLVSGSLAHGLGRTAALGIGALLGAQAGARLSERVHARWILRALAIGLMFVGVRVLLLALQTA